ncbi:hypothetical protein N7507_011806 [Penicillium longicatenatum]|nr:hypothetical protein N7507_011806 [Penicillium longicatenatum]
MSSDIYTPLPPSHPPRDLSQALGPTPLPPRWARSPSPRPHKATMPPGLPRSLCANWSTVLRPDVRQHRLADWSTTPVVCMTFPSAAPARRRRRPTHQGHPANWPARPPPSAGAPPEGGPLWHHRATRGLPGVGCPPGARFSTTSRGQAECTMGPRHRHAAAEPLPKLCVHASLPRLPLRPCPPCETVEPPARSV